MRAIAPPTILLASVLSLASSDSGIAGRAPNPHERARIERALRSEGFVSWQKIEFDDGAWEVDDARQQDGIKYDLKLEPATMRIIKRERD